MHFSRRLIGRVAICLLFSALLAAAADPQPLPRLVVTIVVDQFRYDYLTRFGREYRGGLARLLSEGAVFTNARYEHFPTVTAIGHSTILTGAIPAISGIVGNDWFDRDAGRQVTSVSDPACRIVGGAGGEGASPHRLLVSTIGDELKMASAAKSRVIGISMKDRSAILTSGHSADAAFWFDGARGQFVSSTFYMQDLPRWVKEFNAHALEAYRGEEWLGRTLPQDEKISAAITASPFGNDLLEVFAERAIEAEKLGRGPATDLLTLSFSSNDYIGHAFGPDSPEVREVSLHTDRVLAKLFAYIDAQVGKSNVLYVFTADHGVAPLPEANAARRMPGGRIPAGIQSTVNAELTSRYGAGNWIVSPSEHSLYLNDALIREKKLDPDEVARVAKAAVLKLPHIFRVYTREQLTNGNTIQDQVGKSVMNGFFARRSADLFVLLEPYWMFAATGTTHGTTFSYDAHVPVIFMGQGIRPGKYNAPIAVNDIAPTLATMLEIETPSGSVGRVLTEMLK